MIAALPFAGGDPPELHPGRCVNRRHVDAQCSRCVEACPVQALVLHNCAPELDEAACVRCGLCFHVCPTDVFTPALNYEAKLCETAANLPLEPIALVCAAHPAPGAIAAAVTSVVQHRRCLAALSASDLLELSAGGQRPLWIDDSPCEGCVIGAAHATLTRVADEARALLHACGRPPAILLHSERPPATNLRAQRRPLFDGAQPAMSRRAFLNRFRPSHPNGEVEMPLADLVQRGAPVTERLPQQLPASRRRLLTVLASLKGTERRALQAGVTSFADVQVDGTRCSGCDLCARFCPAGALQFDSQADTFRLSFQPAACVDCGVCVAACPEEAMGFGRTIALAAILDDDVVTLATGSRVPCSGCGMPTAPLPGVSAPRCHVCRQGAGVVTSLRDEAGLMADLLGRLPSTQSQNK